MSDAVKAKCRECGESGVAGEECSECGEYIYKDFKSKCPCCGHLTGFSIPCQACIDDGDAPYDEDADMYYILSRRGNLAKKRRTRGVWNLVPEMPKRVFFSCFGCGAICNVDRADVEQDGLHNNQCVTCDRCGIHQWPKFAGWGNKDKAPRKKP